MKPDQPDDRIYHQTDPISIEELWLSLNQQSREVFGRRTAKSPLEKRAASHGLLAADLLTRLEHGCADCGVKPVPITKLQYDPPSGQAVCLTCRSFRNKKRSGFYLGSVGRTFVTDNVIDDGGTGFDMLTEVSAHERLA